MPQDPEETRQEGEETAGRPEGTVEALASNKTHRNEDDAKGAVKQKIATGKDAIVESVSERKDQAISKISEKLPAPGSLSEATAEAKERAVQLKDRTQVLRTRAAEAARRVPRATKPVGLAVGGALAGSLALLLRRRRKKTRARTRLEAIAEAQGRALREAKWRGAALGLGALLLIGRRIRSRRRRS